VAAFGHSEGESHFYPGKAPKFKSHFDAAESGTLPPAPQAERVDKRDTETTLKDRTTGHDTPNNNPKKTKKHKTEETPKFRERTRSKSRTVAAM
jgi:hypothetical protein